MFRMTGKQWAEKLLIPISDPTGWSSEDDFTSRFISKDEFCNRAANSVIKIEKAVSRREASQKLNEYRERAYGKKTE